MPGSLSSPWLRRFAFATALVTLALIAVGGLVTSHEAGMAVPDWPNTYGYNMFLFPISKWMGGILYEHSHRLVASLVGLLTTVMAGWLWVRETRNGARQVITPGKAARSWWLKLSSRLSAACSRNMASASGIAVIVAVILLMGVRKLPVFIALAGLAPVAIAFSLYRLRRQEDAGGLRWWGMIAFAAVILQGVLGGLRVVLFKDEIGIFHAALAQLFFVLISLIALFTTDWWRNLAPAPAPSPLSRVFLATTLLIFAQLVLGATMRHQHAGLAIPDFPLAYGKLWPAMDNQAILHYNQQRVEIVAANPITAFQISLQMVHRLLALAIVVGVGFCAWASRRSLGWQNPVSKLALVWMGLILAQAILGAATIWSNKAADIATGHVVVGAVCLATGAVVTTVSRRLAASRVASVPVPARTVPLHAQPVENYR